MISFPESCSVLVTGASSGIGRACALLLNNLGATVIACGRDEERLAAARATAAAPDRWHNEPRDLLHDMEHLPDWITDLRGRYGKLWGLLHAAGDGRMDSLRQYDLAEARRHFDINFHVPLLLAKGFADRRNYQRGGAMLFLSSAAAVHPEKGHCLYGAGKAALAAAMQAVSQEVAPAGLRVHCLAPGIYPTHVRHVDGGRIVALHAVTHPVLPEQLRYRTVRLHHVMVARIFPTFTPELRLQIGNLLPLAACRAMHEYPFNTSHLLPPFQPFL